MASTLARPPNHFFGTENASGIIPERFQNRSRIQSESDCTTEAIVGLAPLALSALVPLRV